MIRKLTVLVLCAAGFAAFGTTANATLFSYEKQGDPINGRIHGECGYQCATAWYRAGSGNSGTNGCLKYNWLPNGYYTVRAHYDHYDFTIKGRAWWLSDYYCSSTGVTRDELFVHTEETADQGQACGSPYIEAYCWDGEGDYYSVGCIKVRRRPVDPDGTSHIGKLDNFVHSWGAATNVWVN